MLLRSMGQDLAERRARAIVAHDEGRNAAQEEDEACAQKCLLFCRRVQPLLPLFDLICQMPTAQADADDSASVDQRGHTVSLSQRIGRSPELRPQFRDFATMTFGAFRQDEQVAGQEDQISGSRPQNGPLVEAPLDVRELQAGRQHFTRTRALFQPHGKERDS
jgi:hypothetical protein